MLIFLLAVSLANGADQNMCGSDFNGATMCGAACPGGTDGECPSGEMCYAGVDCPLPPTISPAPTRKPPPPFVLRHDKQVIGYYASWQWYDRAKLTKPQNMDFNKVTRVNYAFFQVDEDGSIWGTDEWADPRVLFGDVDADAGECSAGQPRCRCSWVEPQYKSCLYHQDHTGLIWLAHQARAEVYPSIGGWTLSDAFPPMSKDATSRKIFARNCRNLILDYNFDGIDLDWEYPGYTAHSGTPADKENFNLLLQDIREELDALGAETGRFYGLTAALPCGPSNINNIDIQTVAQYLTEFNLMSYDFHGAWDTNTGVNSPLYDQASDPEAGWSVDGCVKNWVARGAPQEKLNIGLAFYGRSFRNAKELGVEHGGTDEFSWEIDEGTPQYFNVIDQINKMDVEWNEETGTPYAFFNDNKGGLVSFDDERAICLKTDYAIQENLNGFIIWELSGDVMDDLSTPLLNMVNRKLSETDTNCADPFGPKLTTTYTEAPEVPTTTRATTTAAATTVPATAAAVTTSTSTTTASTTTTTSTSTTTTEPATAATIYEEPTPSYEEITMPDTAETAQAISSATATTYEEPTTTYTEIAPETSETAQAISSAIESAQAVSPAMDIAQSVPSPIMLSVSSPMESVSPPMESFTQSFTQFNDGRVKVQRDNTKPNKPYRPPKEELGAEL